MQTAVNPTTKEEVALYDSLEEMIVATAEAVRPPERITVSQAAERFHYVNNPGQHVGFFSLEKTPYLREPMDVLTSLDFTGMIFAGPARTGKSAMAINWLCRTVITDPADMMIVHMAQHTARTWSQADLDKAIRNSPELRKRVSGRRQDDNTYDKKFLSGMRLEVTWPTINNLSGKTVPLQWLMDYDRMEQDINGEGNPFDLTRKRGGTFKRYAMCAAEASPGFLVNDPKWVPTSPHEAPPVGDKKGGGILQLYNRGDRRRWFWRCPNCDSPLQPHFKLLDYPQAGEDEPAIDPLEAAEQTVMICPTNGCRIEPRWQHPLNQGGRWLREGEIWMPDGSVSGTPRRSDIASFWMFGPAAGFTDWKLLVQRYLTALAEYNRTGDEGSLKVTINTDQGDAYTPKAIEAGRLPEELKNRAQDWGGSAKQPVVPVDAEGGFLMATVDVQAGSKPCFVVHVFLVSNGDFWHVDMFKIRKSNRLDSEGERCLLDPAAHKEDWDLLISEVMDRDYPLGDDSGRRMQIKMVACDSGGKEGVTANAYEFYRRLRAAGNHQRFHLLKGAPSRDEATPPLRVSYPDSGQRDRFAIARGDVPVWLINSNTVKDMATNMLAQHVHFPIWAEDWLYTQLTTEIRTPKGWENPSRRRNEAFDLLAYAIAFQRHPDLRTHLVGFWDEPPSWAGPWESNPLVYSPTLEGGKRFIQSPEPPRKSLADLAARLG